MKKCPNFFFYWHRVSKAFAPTTPGGAQALSKEFLVGAPWVIQWAIKFPQSDGHKENTPKLKAPKVDFSLNYTTYNNKRKTG